MIYFVALGGDFECQCKIHLNIQCPCLFTMISGQLLKSKLMIFRDSDDHEWLSNDCQLSDDYEWLSNDSIVWWLNTEHTVIVPDWTLEKGHFLILPSSIARNS